MTLQDRQLVCSSCGQPFVWTAGEQTFYATHQLEHEPRRCRACKHKRPARPVTAAPLPKAVAEVTCSQCGRPTKVPFRPTSGRPVFCRQCYQRRRSPAGR
jgi:CxxC-x17-CxxC domain-containing protein